MKKIRIIAILAAILTAVLVYVFFANINKPNEVEMTSVVTAKVDISKDMVISKDMLTVVELPSEAVNSFAAHNINEVVGKVVNGPVVKDEQIITTKLVEPGESVASLAYAIDEGQRAFTVAVNEVSGVAGLLQPQDYVDVLMIITIDNIVETQNTEGVQNVEGVQTAEETESSVVSRTYSTELFQNIKILAVGKRLDTKLPDEETEYSTVTLSVTPEQAVKLNLAVASGEIRLILRSPLSSEITDCDILTVEDLLED